MKCAHRFSFRFLFQFLLILSLLSAFSVCVSASEEAAVPCPTTVAAADIHHADRFEEKAKIVAEGRIDLVFLGDSITHFWDVAGKDVQEKYFGDLRHVNLGLGWNCTEHVLWELENIDSAKIAPRAVMLMIGTNNLGNKKNSPEEVAAGNAAIVKKVCELWPDAKLLLLGVFPRGNQPNDHYRALIAETNQKLAQLADGQNVFFLDIGERFLDDDGILHKTISPDFLHLTADGYEIWGKAVSPILHGWVLE